MTSSPPTWGDAGLGKGEQGQLWFKAIRRDKSCPLLPELQRPRPQNQYCLHHESYDIHKDHRLGEIAGGERLPWEGRQGRQGERPASNTIRVLRSAERRGARRHPWLRLWRYLSIDRGDPILGGNSHSPSELNLRYSRPFKENRRVERRTFCRPILDQRAVGHQGISYTVVSPSIPRIGASCMVGCRPQLLRIQASQSARARAGTPA